MKQLMVTPVITCSPQDDLDTAAARMWDFDCGALPVVADGRVVGMLTDRDIAMAAYTERRLLADIPVARAMSSQVAVCHPEERIELAERRFKAHQVRRLPVVDETGRVIGILSIDDLAREAADERGNGHRQVSTAAIVDTLAAVAVRRYDDGD